jgi:hypothetical protein
MGDYHQLPPWYNLSMRYAVLVMLICGLCFKSIGQEHPPVEPTVNKFGCPRYPPKAESMRLQGAVSMRVTTDGHLVADVKVLSGHPLLADAAEKNVKTWGFSDHVPTSFNVTYYYVADGYYKRDPITKCSAKMDLPNKVTISTRFSFP